MLAANKKLAAYALRQMANLRLIEKAAPQAVEALRESIALEDVPEARMTLAVAALNAGQPDETLAQTNQLLQSDPHNAHAWYLNGKSLMSKGDYRGAIEPLRHATETAKDPNYRFALAVSFLRTGQKAQAEKIFQQMLTDYGDRAIWHVVFAGAYREANERESAIQEFNRALEMDNEVDHAHFFLGLTLLEQNHWAQTEASMNEFRESVRLHPDDYFSNFFLGAGEAELKLFDSSNQHLQVAVRLQPDVPEGYLYLGLNAFQQQDYPTAKKNLLKAIELTGADQSRNNYQLKRAYVALSRISFMEHEREKSQEYAQRAREMQNKSLAMSEQSIADTMAEGGMGQSAAVMPHANLPKPQTEEELVDPSAPVATSGLDAAQAQQALEWEKRLRQILSQCFNDWGTSEARQGMFNFALQHFQEAEKWDNATPGLMRNVGLAALKVGDGDEAIRAFEVATKLDPTDQLSQARLAMTLFAANRYAEAAKHFSALGEAAYSDPSLAYSWAYSLVKSNQYKQAVEVLNRLTTGNLPAEVLTTVGDLYSVMDFYEPAVANYRKALQEDPSASMAHYKMGAALIRLDRPGDAVPELQAALKAFPEDVDVKYNLAYALLETSQKDQALVLLRSLIEAHPDHPQAQYQLGKTLMDQGKLEEAIGHLEIAAKLDPGRDYIHYQLQTAYRRIGRTAEADNELKIYREIKARKREASPLPMPTAESK